MSKKKLRQNIFVGQTKCWQKKLLAKKIWERKNVGQRFFLEKLVTVQKKINSKTKFYLKNNFGQKKKNIGHFILTLSQNENKNCISATIRTH